MCLAETFGHSLWIIAFAEWNGNSGSPLWSLKDANIRYILNSRGFSWYWEVVASIKAYGNIINQVYSKYFLDWILRIESDFKWKIISQEKSGITLFMTHLKTVTLYPSFICLLVTLESCSIAPIALKNILKTNRVMRYVWPFGEFRNFRIFWNINTMQN